MNKVIAVMLCMLFVLVGLNIAAAEKDKQGSKDHPLLTRMPDFHIIDYSEKDFDKHEFFVQNGKKVSVEGHKYYIQYNLNQGAKETGDLKVVRNIQKATTSIRRAMSLYTAYISTPGRPR